MNAIIYSSCFEIPEVAVYRSMPIKNKHADNADWEKIFARSENKI
jgi:hypothetical protein